MAKLWSHKYTYTVSVLNDTITHQVLICEHKFVVLNKIST